MRWLGYAIAAAAVGMLWTVLKRSRAAGLVPHHNTAAPENQPGSHPASSPVEREMEDQAMARAHSEVASGEYDMQG